MRLHLIIALAGVLAAPLFAEDRKPGELDSKPGAVTPQDQSNDPADLKLTQQIRQAVVKDGSLSMTAKNVKIITAGGKVTLRGPVKSAAEKEIIQKAAEQTAGAGKVANFIEIQAPK